MVQAPNLNRDFVEFVSLGTRESAKLEKGFFSISHGKDVVDCLSGSIKQPVGRHFKSA